MMRYVFALVGLTLVYALALASFEPWDLAFGAGLSAVLLLSFGRLVFGSEWSPASIGRVAAFIPFAVAVGRDVLVGAWEVFLMTVHLRKPSEVGVVAVPLGERSDTGVAVSALVAAFTPGTLLVEVDEEERVMLIHPVNATNPEAVCEAQQEFYRRYQKKVFP